MTNLSKKAYATSKSPGGFNVSFEFFPPSTQRGLFRLLDHVIELQPFEPDFVSVTYGAAGKTRVNTLRTVQAISNLETLDVAGHLTCAGQSEDDTEAAIARYEKTGVKHIVAIRGDVPDEGKTVKKGYGTATDLVAAIRAHGGFKISVAAYPEVHPLAKSAQHDLDVLKAKFDAGADRAITQFCFDNTSILRFMDRVADAGIDKPVVPGILLMHDFWKVKAFCERCGTQVPDWVAARFAGLENDKDAHRLVAAGLAIEQALDLAAHGIRHFHFYTFNTSGLAVAVCRSLGLHQNPDLKQAA